MTKTYWQGFIDGQRNMAMKIGQYSKNFNMKSITREEANKILAECSRGQFQRAVICYQGKWYDIRGMKEEKINEFIISLVGQEAFDRGAVNITVKL